jgi:hypothetical protein
MGDGHYITPMRMSLVRLLPHLLSGCVYDSPRVLRIPRIGALSQVDVTMQLAYRPRINRLSTYSQERYRIPQ